MLRLIFCDPRAVAMWIDTRLTGAKFTLLSRSGSASRTANSEYLLRAEFFCQTNLHVQKLVNADGFSMRMLYGLLTTDMGRCCKKALISALFICKPPL